MTHPVLRKTVLEAENLCKTFGAVQAVDHVGLSARAGEILAVLGPNGAGKTSLMELLTGQRRPDEGRVRILGHAPDSRKARGLVGLTPQNISLPATLKVRELLYYVGEHFLTPLPVNKARDRFLLDDLMGKNAGDLSGGQMRRVALAAAFMGQPRIAFLDEPTTGLDPQAKRALWGAIRDAAARGTQITLTTHDLNEVQQLADRVIVMNRGKIILEDSPDNVRRRLGGSRLRFRATGANGEAPLAGAVLEGGYWVVNVPDGDAAVRVLVQSGVDFKDLEMAPASLEDAILNELEKTDGPDEQNMGSVE